jgi:hypothetical protein
MASDTFRVHVWNSFLDAHRTVLYLNRTVGIYYALHLSLRGLLLASSVTSVVTLLNELGWWWQMTSATMICACIVADYVLNPGNVATVLRSVNIEYKLVVDEWRKVWSIIDGPDTSDSMVQSEISKIRDRERALDSRFRDVYQWTNGVRNERCAKETYEVMRNEFNIRRQANA